MSSLVFLLLIYPRLGAGEDDNLETPGDTDTKSPTKAGSFWPEDQERAV